MARAVAMCAVLVVVVVAELAPSVAAVRALAMAPAWASAAEQQCNVGELISCAPAIIGGTTPTESCCSDLKAQEGCFCQYAKDPAYSEYINSPNARNTLASCGITLPTCSK
uniref:Uncharacterized protein n=1 Tax=Avena sativa TaxID=4498 RepID=A0ACD5TNA7_AVESA